MRRRRVSSRVALVGVALVALLCAAAAGVRAVDPLEDTTWTEERRSVVKIHPQTNEGTNNADFGADDGVEADNTADPALDVVDDDKVADVERRREEWKAANEKRKWKKELGRMARLDEGATSSSWFRKQMARLNKLRTTLMRKTKKNRQQRRLKTTGKKIPDKLLKKIREQIKDKPVLKMHLQKVFKRLNVSVVLLEEEGAPGSSSLTPKEDYETVVGNVVPMVSEDTSTLPIAVETDGENTYVIGTSKLGPELLTKIGTRVEIKGEPVDTAVGETVIEVRGYKVLGAAGDTSLTV